MKNGHIPAPYILEEGDKINDFYLEPVLFHNENGPTIGVTTCGVIIGYPDFLGFGAAVMGDGNYYRSGFGLHY